MTLNVSSFIVLFLYRGRTAATPLLKMCIKNDLLNVFLSEHFNVDCGLFAAMTELLFGMFLFVLPFHNNLLKQNASILNWVFNEAMDFKNKISCWLNYKIIGSIVFPCKWCNRNHSFLFQSRQVLYAVLLQETAKLKLKKTNHLQLTHRINSLYFLKHVCRTQTEIILVWRRGWHQKCFP